MNFFYKIDKAIHFIDIRLLSVKLPSEIKRSTRPLFDKAHFKSNEFRTILSYLVFGMFKGLLPDIYLKNLLKYVIFIRILSQESILKEDVSDAKVLINEFLNEYEDLYGEEVMLSNAHGHLHFPQQVLDCGPLNRTIGYTFENILGICSDKFHGTQNFEGQIAYNLSIKKLINVALKKVALENVNSEMTSFIKTHFLKIPSSHSDSILKPKVVDLSSLNALEIKLVKHLTDLSSLTVSNRATINRREFHTESYDSTFESMNNNCVEFKNKNEISYGKITNFIEMNNKKYCVINKFIVEYNEQFINSLDELTSKHIYKFFIMVNLSSEYELIEFKNIIRKCIFFQYKNNASSEFMCMPCENLEDCD